MPEGCNSNCSSCGLECSARKEQAEVKAGNPNSHIKKTVGVVSGKGGVGKSFVTGGLACALKDKNHSVGIMDADITGPSIPKEFGVNTPATADEFGMYPQPSKGGIDMISMNMLLEDETDPVVWRGPIIGSAVKQFWTDTQWGDKDFLLVDMPPGTGDVPLTVFQSLPVDGIVVVTTPQELVSMVVEKAVKMANEMNVPILGIVENMSYLECPDCDKRIEVFGKSHIDEIAEKYGLPVLARLPINPEAAEAIENGSIEDLDHSGLNEAAEVLEGLLE